MTENPRQGALIGEDIYKVRMAITSKGKGKSGGARILTGIDYQILKDEEKTTVFLIDIYDKSDFESVNTDIVKQLFHSLKEEEE